MDFYYVRFLLVGGLLTGCSTQPPDVDSTNQVQKIAVVESESVPASSSQWSAEAQVFTHLSDLLEFRQRVCIAPEGNTSPSSKEPSELSQDEMFAQLMMATCAPARTPGRLANLLAEAQTLKALPPGFQALIDLLSDQYGAYRLLEMRLEKTQEELSANKATLEKTIEGIRAIDDQMQRVPDAGESKSKVEEVAQ